MCVGLLYIVVVPCCDGFSLFSSLLIFIGGCVNAICLVVGPLAPAFFHIVFMCSGSRSSCVPSGAPRHVCVKRELTNLVIKLTKTRLLSVFGSSGHYDWFYH